MAVNATYNVGDVVYLACKVVSTGEMAMSEEQVLDLVPLEYESREPYDRPPFSVYARDVDVIDDLEQLHEMIDDAENLKRSLNSLHDLLMTMKHKVDDPT